VQVGGERREGDDGQARGGGPPRQAEPATQHPGEHGARGQRDRHRLPTAGHGAGGAVEGTGEVVPGRELPDGERGAHRGDSAGGLGQRPAERPGGRDERAFVPPAGRPAGCVRRSSAPAAATSATTAAVGPRRAHCSVTAAWRRTRSGRASYGERRRSRCDEGRRGAPGSRVPGRDASPRPGGRTHASIGPVSTVGPPPGWHPAGRDSEPSPGRMTIFRKLLLRASAGGGPGPPLGDAARLDRGGHGLERVVVVT
jgi:hypothetical protein